MADESPTALPGLQLIARAEGTTGCPDDLSKRPAWCHVLESREIGVTSRHQGSVAGSFTPSVHLVIDGSCGRGSLGLKRTKTYHNGTYIATSFVLVPVGRATQWRVAATPCLSTKISIDALGSKRKDDLDYLCSVLLTCDTPTPVPRHTAYEITSNVRWLEIRHWRKRRHGGRQDAP